MEKLINTFKSIWNGSRLYSHIFIRAESPGEIIWDLFGERQGRIPIFGRDLICDWKTLQQMEHTGRSTDENTTALFPFLPQFRLNGEHWQRRRKMLSHAFESHYIERVRQPLLPIHLGQGYMDLYEHFFRICYQLGFKYIFGRDPKEKESIQILPGLIDLNRYIKRQVYYIDLPARKATYTSILQLIKREEKGFIFTGIKEFADFPEIDQVSATASDLLFSSTVQPADLICHMLLLREANKEEFDRYSVDECLNETLRLFPLSDIYVRVPYQEKRGWIASLVQLNRNGWKEPNRFMPGRWLEKGHQPNMSWGVEARHCPASQVGIAMVKNVYQAVTQDSGFSITLATDFKHERTFPYGIPSFVSYGPAKVESFKIPKKRLRLFKRWIIERKRMLEQREIW